MIRVRLLAPPPMLNKNKIVKNLAKIFFYSLTALFLFFAWEIYVPISRNSSHIITYEAKRGQGDDEIAVDLQKQGIIKNADFFRLYVVLSFQHSKLQAGKYLLSQNMSIYQIVKKMVLGDILKQKITILPGWDIKDIKKYFKEKNILSSEDFEAALSSDFSKKFEFLSGLPEGVGLEGYLFPDTYQIYEGEPAPEILENMLANFNRKITSDLKNKISEQKKSLYEILTVASMLEKEVRSLNDKKTVAGIIYKRLELGMPLQIDATVNYITDKNDPGVAIKDTKIDSPYNTYKYTGLPKGPISNPGMDSVLAAISPKKTDYLYYLSGYNGKTIFSKTLAEHEAARAIYLTR